MKTWTVQCGYAAYYANVVVVQAETLDQALEKAIAEATMDTSWEALDVGSPTFVDAAAEGADADPWRGACSAIPIPPRFTERGEPPVVTVVVAGGVVQAISTAGGIVRVRVHDYDTDGLPADGIHTDNHGERYALTTWDEKWL